MSLLARATSGVALISFLVAGAASPAFALHSLAGTWLVTYYIDPTGAQGATQCINTFRTGEKDGVTSGTWNSPTLPGWKGKWTEKGQHYAWQGSYDSNGSTFATYDVGDFITPLATAETSAAVFQVTGGISKLTTATATMTMVDHCPNALRHRGPNVMIDGG